MSSDGTEKEEVTMQGAPPEPVSIEQGDGYSRVLKRVVLESDSSQSEVRPDPSLTSQRAGESLAVGGESAHQALCLLMVTHVSVFS